MRRSPRSRGKTARPRPPSYGGRNKEHTSASGAQPGWFPRAAAERQEHNARLAPLDFAQAPFSVVWETTRACALKCLHCRAEAQPRRHPDELTTEESFDLLRQIKEFGDPVFVVTGGDLLMRRDLFTLLEYAISIGLRTSLAPSATKLVTPERLRRIRDLGVKRIAISLDGPNAATHDAFRATPGIFQRTIEVLNDINDLGMSLQINSTVSRYNRDCLEELAELAASFRPTQWSVFFLVPTGRGQVADMLTADEHEQALHWLYDHSKRVPFDVRTTAAQHYRRIVIQRERAARPTPPETSAAGEPSPLTVAGAGYRFQDGLQRPAKGVNDGNGFCFISHTGDVCPSGFLPLAAGNIRQQGLVDLYRNSPLFRNLRDTGELKGKCGRCEFV
ncbi:MAG: TIGR04053 family radical SAM/SPASM domain-containing protein, partial [Chloroflexi bacterium]|nr:TIGR04053 family radical SAM/SPASM domain-containing protein [Chloroflexota bacterium]